jgi:ABC-type transport system involved in cytochrome c biogenesis permease subunit
MNRRAILAAFPLLTVGMVVGAVLEPVSGLSPLWTDPRVIVAMILWFVFAILLYLRYSRHVRGRRAALLTVLAFVLLLVTLIVPHTLSGGQP